MTQRQGQALFCCFPKNLFIAPIPANKAASRPNPASTSRNRFHPTVCGASHREKSQGSRNAYGVLIAQPYAIMILSISQGYSHSQSPVHPQAAEAWNHPFAGRYRMLPNNPQGRIRPVSAQGRATGKTNPLLWPRK